MFGGCKYPILGKKKSFRIEANAAVSECTQSTIKKRDILFLTITLANLNRFL